MNETLTNFRQAVADSTDLQEKIRGGADLVALGKENGYEFTQEELEAGWKELQESDEGLTEFEMDLVSGGFRVRKVLDRRLGAARPEAFNGPGGGGGCG